MYTPGLINTIVGPVTVTGTVVATQTVGDSWRVYIEQLNPENSVAEENQYAIPVRPLLTAAYAVRYEDAGSGISYLGRALVGATDADGLWQLQLIDQSVAGTISIKYPNGVPTFDKVWNDRASYIYA